jgi:hypothetical protein
LEAALSGGTCLPISAATGEGVGRLLAETMRHLERAHETEANDGL